MAHGTRKLTRDNRAKKVLNWLSLNTDVGDIFKASDIAKDLDLTTNDVIRMFPRINGIKLLPGKDSLWMVYEPPTLDDKGV